MKIDIDNHKLMYHPERIAEWREKGDCYPIYVEFGLTNNCNHRCSFCALDFVVGEGKIEYIDSKIVINTLKQMSKKGVKSVMFAGEGEPILHKDIGLFTKTAKNYGMDVSITTNGIAFTEEKIEQCMPNLSWMRFSIDSGSSENYSIVHGTKPKDFERLINNLENAVKFRNENNLETTIGTQFLALSQNIGEAPKLAKILKDIGVDNLQIKPYSHHPGSSNDFSIEMNYYNKLEKELEKFNSDDFKILFRKKSIERLEEGITYNECYGLPFFALIDAKGNVMPCNLFYGNKKFSYGNLNENTFTEIWEGKRRKEIIEKINKKGVKDCRLGCRLDPINKYLDRLSNPYPHDNFI